MRRAGGARAHSSRLRVVAHLLAAAFSEDALAEGIDVDDAEDAEDDQRDSGRRERHVLEGASDLGRADRAPQEGDQCGGATPDAHRDRDAQLL